MFVIKLTLEISALASSTVFISTSLILSLGAGKKVDCQITKTVCHFNPS